MNPPEQKPTPVEQRHREASAEDKDAALAAAKQLHFFWCDWRNEEGASPLIRSEKADMKNACTIEDYFRMHRMDSEARAAADATMKLTETKELRAQLELTQAAGGFCEKHKPTGGSRNCVICGLERLNAAFSKIAVICEGNSEVTAYDVNYDEDEVVKQVDQLRAQLKQTQASYEKCHEEVSRQDAENDQLRAQLATAESECIHLKGTLKYVGDLAEKTEAALREARKDGERLEWLDNGRNCKPGGTYIGDSDHRKYSVEFFTPIRGTPDGFPNGIRAAIDAAM